MTNATTDPVTEDSHSWPVLIERRLALLADRVAELDRRLDDLDQLLFGPVADEPAA